MATKALATYRLIDRPTSRSCLFRDTSYYAADALRKDVLFEVKPFDSKTSQANRRVFTFTQQFKTEYQSSTNTAITAVRRTQCVLDLRLTFGTNTPTADRVSAIDNFIALLTARKAHLADGLLEDGQFEA